MSDAIKFQMVTNQIGRITLNQPAKRNALTADMWKELSEAIAMAAADPDLKVLVVTGEGEHFAAGADISEFETLYATAETSEAISHKISDALNELANFPKPTIAKIRGACVGGGAGIALACDIRFADGTSKFAVTPGKLGLVYPFSDVKRLIQAVGLSNAKDILFSARLILAQEALYMGLVNQVVDQNDLDTVVREYALSICDISGQSAIATKQMFRIYEAGERNETPTTRELFLNGFSSADFTEGYKAFLAKRKPDFK